jgi:hypothetical protein
MAKKLIQKNYLLYGLNNLKNKQIMKEEIIEEAKKVYQKALQDNIELSFYDGVNLGAELQAERMYSEEDMKLAFESGYDLNTFEQLEIPNEEREYLSFKEWFEQNKKK